MKSGKSRPIAITAMEAINPTSTIKLKFCLPSLSRPSPSFFAIMALPPTPSNRPIAIENERNGKMTLTGAKAMGSISRDTKIPSTMPKVPMIIMERMVGKANIKRCFHVGVLVMLSEALLVFSLAALKIIVFFLLCFGMMPSYSSPICNGRIF